MDTLPLISPEQVGLSAARLSRIASWMKGWVDSGKLPGMLVAVMRKGELAFAETYGKADLERNKPMRPDTIFRIYSMTKPITSIAIMMLYEEGRFQLDDPVSRSSRPSRDLRVFTGGSRGRSRRVPAERDITFRDLLTHTSGLTYGFMERNPSMRLYREPGGVDFQTSDDASTRDRRDAARAAADRPARHGLELPSSTDVLGHLVEVISGQPFDEFLRERIFEPLGMVDTGFHVPAGQADRFAANYARGAGRTAEADRRPGARAATCAPRTSLGRRRPGSTASDYLRFCQSC